MTPIHRQIHSAAIWHAAGYLGWKDKVGVIEAGQWADIVAVSKIR